MLSRHLLVSFRTSLPTRNLLFTLSFLPSLFLLQLYPSSPHFSPLISFLAQLTNHVLLKVVWFSFSTEGIDAFLFLPLPKLSIPAGTPCATAVCLWENFHPGAQSQKEQAAQPCREHDSVWGGTTHPFLGPGFSVVFMFRDVYLIPPWKGTHVHFLKTSRNLPLSYLLTENFSRSWNVIMLTIPLTL